MASHNNFEAMFYSNGHDRNKSKVYINPNFNRPSMNNYPNNAVMHVNPRFPHLLTNMQPNNKAKIHVNPNFMKSKTGNNYNLIMSTNINSVEQEVASSFSSACSRELETSRLTVQVPIAKSRYSLVRQNATKSFVSSVTDNKPKNTFQVNKYKSIPLNEIKRNLDNPETVSKLTISTPRIDSSYTSVNKKYLSSPISNKNQFKLVNHNNPAVRTEKMKQKTFIDSRKKILLNQSRLKIIKGNIKKNNIPCPMFRKFGKCLRKARGNCEYLHDKKHVSICRKFIKGLCHDNNCLLSHDLTKKKMPTCFFYLQGTCTKTECPYLHVKLNERAKVCPDFLKGYCEKGSKCLQRHINIQAEKKVKDTITSRSLSTLKKKYRKPKGKILDPIEGKIKQSNENSTLTENLECRYYQEHKSNETAIEICQIIKPMRCKLGTLPSFIQL